MYMTPTMIFNEDMKPIEHVLLHPICALSHLMCPCKHYDLKSSLCYWVWGAVCKKIISDRFSTKTTKSAHNQL